MAAKKACKKGKNHVILSSVFLIIAVICYILLIGVYTIVGHPLFWPLLGCGIAIISLILIESEKRRGLLGKGKWLWSIFTTAALVGVSLSIAQTQPTAVALISAIASIVALILLIKEKYSIKAS